MGTFHQGKHALHGITVVVGTAGDELYVGRCDDVDERLVVLLDVAVHRPEDGEASAWLERAARFGVWPEHRRLAIDRQRVTSIRPLGEISP
ncbi:MAG: hypothetical protein D6696_12070 [Acidobacteria bacterium]|nr:MAG: hypothetical protein D6696_12070 [Acidobacteriota bacterium]